MDVPRTVVMWIAIRCAPCALLPAIAAAQLTAPSARIVESFRIDTERENFASVGVVFVNRGGTVVAVDYQDRRLRFYGSDARRLAVSGGHGTGPGEFESMNGLRAGWMADTLWVSSGGSRRISYFRSTGEFVRAAAMPALPIRPSGSAAASWPALFNEVRAVYPDGSYLLVAAWPPRGTHERPEPRHGFVHMAVDGALARPIGLMPIYGSTVRSALEPGAGTLVPFALDPLVAVSPDGNAIAVLRTDVVEGTRGVARLVVVRPAGDTILRREFAFVGRPLSARSADSVLSLTGQGFPAAVASDLRRAARRLIPPFHPPVLRVVLGIDGTIWLCLEPLYPVERWLMLTPDGTLAAIVPVGHPEKFDFHQASAQFIWGVVRKESGFADIVRYRILR